MNFVAPIRIAGISGSLRQASFSTALIKLLAQHLQPAIDLSLVDISEVPLYKEDLDGDTKPAAVHAVNTAIAQADAVLLVTPEYDYLCSPIALRNYLKMQSGQVFYSRIGLSVSATRSPSRVPPEGVTNAIGNSHGRLCSGHSFLTAIDHLVASLSLATGAETDDEHCRSSPCLAKVRPAVGCCSAPKGALRRCGSE
jgi:hypothetical protein